MAQAPGHKDRLSVVDNSFLAQEKGSAHMHVGALMVFDGPPVDYLELVEHIEARLHLVPRYRQRLAMPRLEMGRPMWVDDPSFNIHYHVRHTALPAPGTTDELRAPGQSRARARASAEGLGEVAWATVNAAPATPLNVEIGPHRRLRDVTFELDDFKAIKNALGGTVNDVVLAIVSGALRRWL